MDSSIVSEKIWTLAIQGTQDGAFHAVYAYGVSVVISLSGVGHSVLRELYNGPYHMATFLCGWLRWGLVREQAYLDTFTLFHSSYEVSLVNREP